MTDTHVMVGARFRLVLLTMAATTGAAILGALVAPGWVVPTLVNLAVVERTEHHQVVERRPASMQPVLDVMAVEKSLIRAAGEAASLVANP